MLNEDASVLLSAPKQLTHQRCLEFHTIEVPSATVFFRLPPAARVLNPERTAISVIKAISWVLGFVVAALSHVSNMSRYRLMKLDTSYLSNLPGFLSPEHSAYGVGILENTSTALRAEIRHLSNPVSADYFPPAGEIEDRATNSALPVDRVGRIVDNLYDILGMGLVDIYDQPYGANWSQALKIKINMRYGQRGV